MIDFTQPIRSVRTKTRLYVVGHDRDGARLDLRKDSHWKSGVLYGRDGEPIEYSPMGPVENFEEESPFEEIVDVAEARQREEEAAERQRFNAQVQDDLADNELFGLF